MTGWNYNLLLLEKTSLSVLAYAAAAAGTITGRPLSCTFGFRGFDSFEDCTTRDTWAGLRFAGMTSLGGESLATLALRSAWFSCQPACSDVSSTFSRRVSIG